MECKEFRSEFGVQRGVKEKTYYGWGKGKTTTEYWDCRNLNHDKRMVARPR